MAKYKYIMRYFQENAPSKTSLSLARFLEESRKTFFFSRGTHERHKMKNWIAKDF